MEKLQKVAPQSTSTPAMMPRSSLKGSRPSLNEVFSPLASNDAAPSTPGPPSEPAQSAPSLPDISSSDMSLDLSQALKGLPALPPGLYDEHGPTYDSSQDPDGGHNAPMSSTPFRDVKGKGKERASDVPEEKENISPDVAAVDETIFHSQEKPPRLPSVLHNRNHSFSFGQSVFYSMDGNDKSNRSSNSSSILPSPSIQSKKSEHSNKSADSPISISKSRGRALSDSVFTNMLRASAKPAEAEPEADINDESSADLVVYSGGTPEPDPFRMDATTYYTPQTLIPTTPPQGRPPAAHMRKTSKEESIIFSLHAQLALQKELCGQYEADLSARDELVDVLGKKLAETEKEDIKRRGVLRAWKKKVAELEKTCRYLEEEVEGSRHESMERSVMDEASSEALRMLHRQIASLEREKAEWNRKEEILREEVGTLEQIVKERSDEVMELKESLWSRDESERELKEGIRNAKEQIEMMGNVSVGMVDEDELKKLIEEREMKNGANRAAEVEWEQQRDELKMGLENVQAEKAVFQEEVESLKQQLRNQEEEYGVLKAELEAQWQHTENASEKTEALENERRELEKERETLKAHVEEFEQRINSMELEWNDSENKKIELENEIQELWNTNEALEKEREEVQSFYVHPLGTY